VRKLRCCSCRAGRIRASAWRNLLKSSNVDLVRYDSTPAREAGRHADQRAAIAFPTRELFQPEDQRVPADHLRPRYARQGVLPIIYFDNIARYVRDGGAVMVAAGPDYASQTSIWRTPLDQILP
jgi:hypothetical protein